MLFDKKKRNFYFSLLKINVIGNCNIRNNRRVSTKVFEVFFKYFILMLIKMFFLSRKIKTWFQL